MRVAIDGWTGDASSRTARVTPLVIPLLLGAATVLQLMRQWAVSAWDTIWAEDGYVFLTEAVGRSIPTTLVDPYGGYIHLGPRAAAAAAASLPLESAAVVFAVTWAVAVGLLATLVYFGSAGILRSTGLRVALAGLVALLPAAGSELIGNAANLHFYLVFGCFWAFVWRSVTPAALGARVAVVAVTALSDPLTLLFTPLALWNAVGRRARAELVVPATFVGGLAIQFAAIALAGEPPQRLTRFDAGDLLPLFALRVTGSFVVGDRFIDDAWFAFGRAFSYGALGAVAVALVLGAATTGRPTRGFVAVSSTYAAVFFAVFLAGRGTAGMRPGSSEATWHLAGARFTYAPILFLAAALLAVVDWHAARARVRAARIIVGVTVLFVTTLIVSNFSFSSERSLGPQWRPELREARERCDRGAEEARVRVAPAPFGFDFLVACRDLR
ncbi:MAG: hypothetical protein M3265_00720 [Actinomycetota bacterium]|nr:hypothetical protein [Actinomycetota bacterium]